MIPTQIGEDIEVQDFTIFNEATDLPTLTYRMHLDKNRVWGYVDEQNAMEQAIFKILNTERYQYSKIYSDNYGIELADLFGMPVSFVVPELERRIKEALTWDGRILACYNFQFEQKKRGVVSVKFTAQTIFGNLTINGYEVVV